MKKTFLIHTLLIGIFIASINPHKARAMDDLPETYSSFAIGAATVASLGLAWLINYFCRSSSDRSETSHVMPLQTFSAWKAACDTLPRKNCEFLHTALNLTELMRVVRAYTDLEMYSGRFLAPEKWLGTIPRDVPIFNGEFTPYVQKLIVDSTAEIAFHGDLHGDIHSLNAFIQDLNNRGKMDGFTITQDNFYMLFLGDYTDRGYYGAEVWYTILRLKLANPDRVFMVRGNHEDCEFNARDGFLEELQAKFGGSKNNLEFFELQRLYNVLPVAIYLGTGTAEEINYLLCCHGGLELGFNPIPLFEDPRGNLNTLVLDQDRFLDRSHGLAKLSEPVQQAIRKKIPGPFLCKSRLDKPVTVTDIGKYQYANQIGFMWNDYLLNTTEIVGFMNGRGWTFGKLLTQETLAMHSTERHNLKGVFRAHQHGDLDMMHRILNRDNKSHAEDAGVGKLWTDHEKIIQPHALWDGIVCTFLVAPAVFGEIEDCRFDYDAFGILKMSPAFDDWRLEIVRISNPSSASQSSSTDTQSLSVASSSSGSNPTSRYASVVSASSNADLSDLFG